MRIKNAFTLVELLVVISVIGVLTGILLPNFVSSRERARDAKRKQDLADIKSALRMYYNDNQSYPPLGGLSAISPDYIQTLPIDPATEDDYGYCVSVDGDKFALYTMLENTADQSINADNGECVSVCGLEDDCVCEVNCYYVYGN